MALFDSTLEAFHRAGNVAHVAEALAELVVVYDHIGRPDVAAILYGASQRHAQPPTVVGLPAAIQHLRDTLSTQDYDAHVATGHSMSLSDAVRYAREQLGHDPH